MAVHNLLGLKKTNRDFSAREFERKINLIYPFLHPYVVIWA